MPNGRELPVYIKASLLDRLTSPKDDYLTGGRRPAHEADYGGLREKAYRDTLLRDLRWLFNATSPLNFADSDLRRKYPNAFSSILGYGLRGVLGRMVRDPAEIERQIADALKAFEPRLRVDGMSLKLSRDGQLIEIEIKGLLLTQNAKRHLWIRTDLETLESKVRGDNEG
jgi:predicted component of type VI protein secretion system